MLCFVQQLQKTVEWKTGVSNSARKVSRIVNLMMVITTSRVSKGVMTTLYWV